VDQNAGVLVWLLCGAAWGAGGRGAMGGGGEGGGRPTGDEGVCCW
jgi:hypothetical protein